RLPRLRLLLLQQLAGVGQGLLRGDAPRRGLLRRLLCHLLLCHLLGGGLFRGDLLRHGLLRDLLRRDLLRRGLLRRDLLRRLPGCLLRCASTRWHADAGHVASLARYYRRWATGITLDIHAG